MLLTGICCKQIIGDGYENVAVTLDSYIKSNNYDRGCAYIEALDINESKKEVLLKCFLSYKECC